MQGLGQMLVASYAAFLWKNGANKHLLPCKECNSRFLGAKLSLNVHQLVGKALQFNSTFYLQDSAKIIIVALLSLVEHNNEMESR